MPVNLSCLHVHGVARFGMCYYPLNHAMANWQSTPDLKDEVRDFWNSDPCGTRYLEGQDDFAAHARARYTLEPHIPRFAKFSTSKGMRVLEVGVGMGADYLEWLKAGAIATGVDLSSASLERARARCLSAGLVPDLHLADAENLPFLSETFDVVYSYGVMHHSPGTQRCFHEALRVLKPGGEARLMIYHHSSLVGCMLWLRYGLLRGKSLRRSVYDHLESPGTKTYTKAEARALLQAFEDIRMQQVLSPGDLLLNEPSAKYRSPIYRLVWKLFPRKLARMFGQRWGLFLLITARKPCADS
jgi:ubiquinone/menaquinone biosynthesis C-methylase UbiE